MSFANDRASLPPGVEILGSYVGDVDVDLLPEEDRRCIICLDLFNGMEGDASVEPEDPVRVQPCGHMFGHRCITRHLSDTSRSASGYCPLCRVALYENLPFELRETEIEEYWDGHEWVPFINALNRSIQTRSASSPTSIPLGIGGTLTLGHHPMAGSSGQHRGVASNPSHSSGSDNMIEAEATDQSSARLSDVPVQLNENQRQYYPLQLQNMSTSTYPSSIASLSTGITSDLRMQSQFTHAFNQYQWQRQSLHTPAFVQATPTLMPQSIRPSPQLPGVDTRDWATQQNSPVHFEGITPRRFPPPSSLARTHLHHNTSPRNRTRYDQLEGRPHPSITPLPPDDRNRPPDRSYLEPQQPRGSQRSLIWGSFGRPSSPARPSPSILQRRNASLMGPTTATQPVDVAAGPSSGVLQVRNPNRIIDIQGTQLVTFVVGSSTSILKVRNPDHVDDLQLAQPTPRMASRESRRRMEEGETSDDSGQASEYGQTSESEHDLEDQ